MTMSEHPDMALVRQGYEAFSRGDMETLGSLMTTDCVHHVPGSSQISGHHKGRDGVIGLYAKLAELSNGTMRVDLENVFVDGRGHAMSVHQFRADRGDRGLEMKGGLFFTIVGGKISDIDECIVDIEEADSFWGTA